MRASPLPVLVYLWLCLVPALGYPVPKRLSGSEIGEDVLAGSDFLSVFMRTSPSRSVAINPASPKYGGIFGAKTKTSDYTDTNSVLQKGRNDIPQPFNDINLKGDDALDAARVDYGAQPVDLLDEDNAAFSRDDHSAQEVTMTTADNRNANDTLTSAITEQPTTTTATATKEETDEEEEEEVVASPFYDLDEEEPPEIVHGFRDDRSTKPTLTQYWSSEPDIPSIPPPTAESANSEDQPSQVISVRVSSSVVRHSHKGDDQPQAKPFESEKIGKPASTLVIQEQPTITAIQRSHLNVEEATLPDERPFAAYQSPSGNIRHHQRLAVPSPHPPPPPPPQPLPPAPPAAPPLPLIPAVVRPYLDSYKYHELEKPAAREPDTTKVSLLSIGDSQRKADRNTPEISADYHNSPESLTAEQEEIKVQQTDFLKLKEAQNQTDSENAKRYGAEGRYEHQKPLDDGEASKERQAYGREDRKQDYSKEPQALAYRYNPQNPQLSPVSYHTSVSSATSGSRVQFYSEPPGYRRGSVAETVQHPVLAETKHREPPERSYEEPERVYATPEQNYEVDEVVSVVTNGRSHGVQGPTAPPPAPEQPPAAAAGEDNNKFGYVVEGRNFRKYRVEERTADGFIVGEYGVVSHDDGSLRGVRYTADSTINPRLIYDALVKFLSLK